MTMPHPQIIRALAGEHQRDMLRATENRRLVREARKARKTAREEEEAKMNAFSLLIRKVIGA
jgi:hypothetical protein